MPNHSSNRRMFLQSLAATTLGAAAAQNIVTAAGPPAVKSVSAETLVGQLYGTLNAKQKSAICFDWNHRAGKRGLLRTFVANNWNVTKPSINDDFYTDEQRDLCRSVFESIIHPDWHARYDQQLEDDAGGFGNEQSIAIFGKPGDGKFELVLTGRHMTLRCDGNSADHVAFGGPIFYGHAPTFNEDPKHIDNVFWGQALAANKLYQMLDGKQRVRALLPKTPREQSVAFRGKRSIPGLPVSDMSVDQKKHLQGVLGLLMEMYRTSDSAEAMQCLKKQGGLDACRLAFFSDHDLGGDEVWDNWRLEGPSFVWHYRGAPHVHVWVNVADSPAVKTNT
ncbi:MAG: DUF3500 domain-containing protein [Planctomycetota bacterium]